MSVAGILRAVVVAGLVAVPVAGQAPGPAAPVLPPALQAEVTQLALQGEIVRLRKLAADAEYAANQCLLAAANAALDAKVKHAHATAP